jgi:hypothetical protein
MQSIIMPAVKFELLSASFKIKTQVLQKSIMNYACMVYGQNVMSEETVRHWCRIIIDFF